VFDGNDSRHRFLKKTPDTSYGRAIKSKGEMGAGVKQRANIASAARATSMRVRSSGMCSSIVGGCLGPVSASMPTISTVHTIQLVETKLSPTAQSTPDHLNAFNAKYGTNF